MTASLLPGPRTRFRVTRICLQLVILAAIVSLCGCATITNPVADGIPVRRLPPEVFGESRSAMVPVPLTSLIPPTTDVYKLAPGDVLGIWIESILGERGATPPIQAADRNDRPPGIGFPIPVRDNGTIPLPLIEPVPVEGLTLEEAQTKIIQAYTTPRRFLKEGGERVIVTLIKPRQYHILVLREDSGGTTVNSTGGFGANFGGGTSVSQTFRTAGYSLDLPAYENNLLNALAKSGGLPGAEAQDYVLIERGAYRQPPGVARKGEEKIEEFEGRGRQTIRVPLRLRPGEPLSVKPTDLILESGDVVLVKARKGDYFYTGGLLPTRVFPLPADRDLDVLEALALVGGSVLNGTINGSNLSGSTTSAGLGLPSASLVTIVRKTANGGQIPILVSVNRAMKDPRERIAVKPGDFLVMQFTPKEGVAQYLTSQIQFRFNGVFGNQTQFPGTGGAAVFP